MMSALSNPTSASHPSFRHIVCAIDGSRGSGEAVRQGLTLCGPSSRIRFVAVTDVRGEGANRMASLGEHRATQALAAARALGRERGLDVDIELVHAADVPVAILDHAAGADLLVAGCHPGSRASGIATGAVATALTHNADLPLLIARPAPADGHFPQRIVVACDTLRDGQPLVDVAARLATTHGAHVDLAHAGACDSSSRHCLAVLAASLREQTGLDPVVHTSHGSAVSVIVAAADRVDANLLIVGRRGLQGVRAIGSVSERIVHTASCSVLIMPLT